MSSLVGAEVGTAIVDGAHRVEVHSTMSRNVGVLRDAASLHAAGDALEAVAGKADPAGTPSRSSWETTNILTVASAVVAAAARRTESRGSHRRTDFPESRDEWLRHIDVRLDGDGSVRTT